MRSDYIRREEFEHILAALTPPNRLAMRVSLATGLRIGDVLNLRTEQIQKAAKNKVCRPTVRELKTGKSRRVTIPRELCDELLSQAGKIYLFENRLDQRKHRTRNAVWKDVKRAASLFRVDPNLQISPHSARKIYAVSEYQTSGSLKHVQELLKHSSESITMVYAMADQMTMRRLHQKGHGTRR